MALYSYTQNRHTDVCITILYRLIMTSGAQIAFASGEACDFHGERRFCYQARIECSASKLSILELRRQLQKNSGKICFIAITRALLHHSQPQQSPWHLCLGYCIRSVRNSHTLNSTFSKCPAHRFINSFALSSSPIWVDKTSINSISGGAMAPQFS